MGKSDPSATTSNENLDQTSFQHVLDVPKKDGHSKKSHSPKKLHTSKDSPLAKFARCTRHIVVQLLYYLFFALCICVVFLLGLGVGLGLFVLFFVSGSVVSLAMLPVLVVSLLFTRTFQFIKCGENYKKLTRFKHLLRGWLYINVFTVLIGLWIFYPFAKFIHSLKSIVVLDLHLTKWVVIITIACAFYLVSFVMYQIIHQVAIMVRKIGGSVNIPQAISEIIDGLIFWWAKHEVMKRVPAFQDHELLGLPTRKWIRVSILVLIGYNFITLFTHLTVLALRHGCQQCPNTASAAYTGSIWQSLFRNQLHTKYVVHFAKEMRLSISFIMSSVLLLLTWILYFGERLDMEVATVQSIWEVGKWTFTSLLICSVLWLIKSFVLLTWEVNKVYRRLEPKIKSISKQLYFLGNLGYGKHDFFKLHQHQPENDEDLPEKESAKGGDFANTIIGFASKVLTSLQYYKAKEFTNKWIDQKRERVKKELLMAKHPTLDDLRRATCYFLTAHKCLQKKKYISGILSNFNKYGDKTSWKTWMELNNDRDGSNWEEKNIKDDEPKAEAQSSTSSSSRSQHCARDEWDLFVELVDTKPENSIPTKPENSIPTKPENSIPLTSFHTWVERAHNKCMWLSNTLSSLHEVRSTLNNIISWLLIGLTFIMWLLLTGFATTQVLVLIASPLLAATFIFGKSCRTLFEGLLFVYVIQPFEIGDVCVIENKKMTVTSIDIWKTTFSEVDKQSTREVLIYPNVELASKVILNHRTKLIDWSDCLEFNLDDVEETKLTHEDLKNLFERYMKGKLVANLSGIPILTIVTKGGTFQLVIRLKYNSGSTKDWTYSECFRKKEKLQTEFYLAMKETIRYLKDNNYRPEPSSGEIKLN